VLGNNDLPVTDNKNANSDGGNQTVFQQNLN